jgi:hypothetical protein
MRRLTWLAGVAAVSLLLVTQSAFAAADNACTADEIARGKATICHHPPGNPTNASTLCVGVAAVPAHLANHPGDSVGACANPCPNGCDDSDPCTTDSCGASGCEHAVIDPCCQGDQDCAGATLCAGAETCDLATHTCTAGTPTDCDDNNSCTDDSCNVTDGCVHEDNGTCCCQTFAAPPNGTDDFDHCNQGCVNCPVDRCVEQSTCPTVPTGDPSTCPGFPPA